MSTHNSTNTPGHTIAPGKTLAAGHALAGSTSTRSRSAPPVPPTPAVTPAHRVLVLTFLLLLGLLGALVAPLVASADPAAGSSARVKCKVVVGANSPVFAASSGNWYQARDNVAERGNAQLTDRLGVPDITTDFVQAGDVVWGYPNQVWNDNYGTRSPVPMRQLDGGGWINANILGDPFNCTS